MNTFDLSLYLVTDRKMAEGRSLEHIVMEAVKGGVTMLQLREKDCSTLDFVKYAINFHKLLKPLGIPMIINDRLDVALASDAEGLHIGQDDMPYSIARKLLGPDKIIGLSVENMDEVKEANKLDVDYIGISPVFSTNTKTDTAAPFGIEGIKKVSEITLHTSVAIGGIHDSNVFQVISAGADGVAVVSEIIASKDPYMSAKKMKEKILIAKNNS